MVGLEGISRIMELQPPHHTQGHQPPHFRPAQAAQGPIQPGLQHLHGWTGHPQPLWAAVPAPPHSQSKELPLTSNLNLPSKYFSRWLPAKLYSTLAEAFLVSFPPFNSTQFTKWCGFVLKYTIFRVPVMKINMLKSFPHLSLALYIYLKTSDPIQTVQALIHHSCKSQTEQLRL